MSRDGWLYGLTITASAALLFLVQPIIAKAILPHYGGSAGVWVASMLFFQVALLAGYLYSYGLTRLSPRLQTPIHLALLAVSLAALPLRPRFELAPTGSPAFSILFLLAASAGLPYFVLSTTSPLLQSWFTGRGAKFPYRLFALSNAASLAALFSYPVILEPLLSAHHQFQAWSAAYLVTALLIAIAALRTASRSTDPKPDALIPAEPQPLLWIALAACPSLLWLAVANHLSQEVAPIPFLWVLPLGLYLLSFILCFEGREFYRPTLFRWLLPAAWIAVALRITLQGSFGGLLWDIPILSAALFVCCMFCHGELADSKPDARQGLPFFYLMVSLGGALGGIFVALAAPHLFTTYLELPIGITGSVLLALYLLFGLPLKRLLRLALFAVLAFVLALQYRSGDSDVLRIRNFYGVLQVRDRGEGENAARTLYSGVTLHGLQFQSPDRSHMATVYYGQESGIARALSLVSAPARHVAVIGLGAGTLAAYGRRGDSFRFYDINPAILDVAQRDFTFLSQSAAQISLTLDDGRLGLTREPPASFDVIVLDAFSDDSIPIHLLTREALDLYFERLKPGGILALHITNRYLDLEPVVSALAASIHLQVLFLQNPPDPDRAIAEADWAILSGHPLPELMPFSHPPPPPVLRPWTDDYSNLFRALRH